MFPAATQALLRWFWGCWFSAVHLVHLLSKLHHELVSGCECEWLNVLSTESVWMDQISSGFYAGPGSGQARLIPPWLYNERIISKWQQRAGIRPLCLLQKGQVTSERAWVFARRRVFQGREQHRRAFALMEHLLSGESEESLMTLVLRCQGLNEQTGDGGTEGGGGSHHQPWPPSISSRVVMRPSPLAATDLL